MGLALQGALALLAGFQPGGAALQLAGGFPLAGHFQEGIERFASVGNDAQVGHEHAADLGRFDVDVDELAAFGVDLDGAGVAVRPAVADAEHQVGFQQGGVAVAVRSLQADHAGHLRVVVGDHAPAHQGRDDRNAGQLGEFLEFVGGVGVEDATACDQQRALGVIQHRQGLLGLYASGFRLAHRQRLVGVDVELDLGHLHVERQVDQHGAGTVAAHQLEGLLEHVGHLGRFQHGGGPLGDRRGDLGDVDGLEVFLVQTGTRRLAGDAEDRDGVGRGGVQAGDHVSAGRAGGADAHADVAGPGAGVTLGHVRRAFDVTGQDVVDAADFLQRSVHGVDGGARHAERGIHAFTTHYQYGSLDCSHSGHILFLGFYTDCVQK
ncbi:hypothetical protein D9M69_200560 [compost metagenome]